METLKTAVLFPLRSEESELSAFSESYPFEFYLTPYVESSELISNRGLNQGVNSANIEEPLVSESHLSYNVENRCYQYNLQDVVLFVVHCTS